MITYFKPWRAALTCLLAAAAMLLAACSTTATAPSAGAGQFQAFGPLTSDSAGYSRMLEQNAGPRFPLLILLARSQLTAGDQQGFQDTLARLRAEASGPAGQSQIALVEAAQLYRAGSLNDAQRMLQTVDRSQLDSQAVIYFYQLDSGIHARLFEASGNLQDQLRAYEDQKALLPLVSGENRTTTIRRCTELLGQLSDTDLYNLLNASGNDLDRGFYEYAIISASESEKVRAALQDDFRKKYPAHPVLSLSGTQAASQASRPAERTAAAAPFTGASLGANAKIAVLLPLSGRFGQNIGEIARQGILAALNDAQLKASVVFYDTQRYNVSDIVNRISSDGTTLILGPILKPEVAALNRSGNKIPSIVFNQPEAPAPGQLYFDLGPNYEGMIAAAKINHDGFRRPLVISLNSKNSQRAVSAFTTAFARSGSQPLTCPIDDAAAISSVIPSCPVAQADAVYISAPAEAAVSIKALLPKEMPVYLTDASFEGYNNSAQAIAMSGALMGDMPWLLTDSPLKEAFMKTIPKANAQAQKIFAAAYDSIGVAVYHKQLSSGSGEVLHGLSGDISISSSGLIESTPLWVKLGTTAVPGL